MLLKLCLSLVLAVPLASQNAPLIPQVYYHTFSHTNPVFQRIRPGQVVDTRTLDSGGQDEKDVHRDGPSNPLTGPFYVEGAQPGDALLVTFRKIRLNRNWGYSGYRLGVIALSPESLESTYRDHYEDDLVRKGRANLVPWDLNLARQTVRLREPVSRQIKLEFPAHPMLGCVGVAAPGDFVPTSSPAGSWGGNMDYNRVAEGATVMLPVTHPGALLYVGDGHAIMADGEPTGTGVETSMDVEFSVALRKHANLTGPRLENADEIVSIGAQPEFQSSLDRALQLATTDMVRWLTEEYHLEPWAAHQLIGAVGQFDVVTVQGTMALRLPKRLLAAKP